MAAVSVQLLGSKVKSLVLFFSFLRQFQLCPFLALETLPDSTLLSLSRAATTTLAWTSAKSHLTVPAPSLVLFNPFPKRSQCSLTTNHITPLPGCNLPKTSPLHGTGTPKSFPGPESPTWPGPSQPANSSPTMPLPVLHASTCFRCWGHCTHGFLVFSWPVPLRYLIVSLNVTSSERFFLIPQSEVVSQSLFSCTLHDYEMLTPS